MLAHDEITETHYCEVWVIEQIIQHRDGNGWAKLADLLSDIPASHQAGATDAIIRALLDGLIGFDLDVDRITLLVRLVK